MCWKLLKTEQKERTEKKFQHGRELYKNIRDELIEIATTPAHIHT